MKYAVYSKELSRVEPICDDGSGPTEYYCCYLEVEAKSKREAIHIAVKDKEFKDWVDYQKSDNHCPFAGVTAEELPEDPWELYR